MQYPGYMNILKFTLLFCFFLSAALVQAQIQDDLWFDGHVQLENGETVEGKLSYYSDNKTGLLQINIGSKILSYDAKQIISFSFYDNKLGINRRFYSLPYQREGENYDIMLFFEANYEGSHLSLLSKTIFRTETRATNPYSYRYGGYYIPSWYNDPFMSRTYNVMVPYETLYLVSPESNIEQYAEPTPVNSKRVRYRKPDYELLLKLMKDKRGKIENFIEKHKLEYRDKTDLVKIVHYYNSLKQEEAEGQAARE